MSSTDQVAEEICKSLENSAAAWSLENYTHSLEVMYYFSAINMIERKSFEDFGVKYRVLMFLNDQLNKASDKLMADATKSVDDILMRYVTPIKGV